MPVLSGVFGMLAEKCLPLSLNDDIRIEISLESNDAAVCYAAAYGLKSLRCFPRRNTEIVSALAYLLSFRINPNFQSWYWRVGSLLIPQKTITISNASTTGSYADGYIECIKAIHGLNNANYCSTIGIRQYQIAYAADVLDGDGVSSNYSVLGPNTAGNSYENAFIIGQELEVFSGRNDTLFGGMNTLGSQIFFEASIGSTGPGAGYTLDFFAFADCIFIKQDFRYNKIISICRGRRELKLYINLNKHSCRTTNKTFFRWNIFSIIYNNNILFFITIFIIFNIYYFFLWLLFLHDNFFF